MLGESESRSMVVLRRSVLKANGRENITGGSGHRIPDNILYLQMSLPLRRGPISTFLRNVIASFQKNIFKVAVQSVPTDVLFY